MVIVISATDVTLETIPEMAETEKSESVEMTLEADGSGIPVAEVIEVSVLSISPWYAGICASQLGERGRDHEEEPGDHADERDDRDGKRQPVRHSSPLEPPHQHAEQDGKKDREQQGPDDRGGSCIPARMMITPARMMTIRSDSLWFAGRSHTIDRSCFSIWHKQIIWYSHPPVGVYSDDPLPVTARKNGGDTSSSRNGRADLTG